MPGKIKQAAKGKKEVVAKKKAEKGIPSHIVELLGGLKEAIVEAAECSDSHGKKVLKTIPFRKEWKAGYAELDEQAQILMQGKAKLDTLRKAFWARIEIETGIFDKHLHYNEEKGVIEVLEDQD